MGQRGRGRGGGGRGGHGRGAAQRLHRRLQRMCHPRMVGVHPCQRRGRWSGGLRTRVKVEKGKAVRRASRLQEGEGLRAGRLRCTPQMQSEVQSRRAGAPTHLQLEGGHGAERQQAGQAQAGGRSARHRWRRRCGHRGDAGRGGRLVRRQRAGGGRLGGRRRLALVVASGQPTAALCGCRAGQAAGRLSWDRLRSKSSRRVGCMPMHLSAPLPRASTHLLVGAVKQHHGLHRGLHLSGAAAGGRRAAPPRHARARSLVGQGHQGCGGRSGRSEGRMCDRQ